MLRVIREDKQTDSREQDIIPDWQTWATNNGYVKRNDIPVRCGSMRIKLQVWTHPTATTDAYLMYHPLIPETVDTESLYILTDENTLDAMVDISRQMASNVMQMIQARKQFKAPLN